MKPLLMLTLLLFLAASCSKERSFNRKLDGDWSASIYFGQFPSSQENYLFHFDRQSKDSGKGYLIIEDGFYERTLGIDYYINDDNLTLIIDSDAYAFKIKSFSRRKIELIDSYGSVTILE